MRRSRKTKQKERGGDVSYRRKTSQNASKKSPPDLAADHDGGRFYGCYLLTSLSPRYKGHTYIGFTVNPKRRIRQHNGEITSGASSTKRKRPWEMVLCIHGFPTNVAALQFEWAWQHPRDSIAVRETAVSFKTLGGIANKIKLALTMLTLPSWNCLDLTVSFFSTNYMKHTAGCPTLPRQMKLHLSSLDELPCYSDPLCPSASDHDDDDDDDDDNLHSYLNPDTVDVFDHLNGPPVFGSIETDPSSVNSQSYTHQNTPEHICSHQSIGEPSDEESFYMISNPRPEEQSSPHKFPADVGGSGDEHLWPGLGDYVSPFGSHTFSSSLLPILKKHNLNDYTKPSKEEPSRRPDPSVIEQPSKFDFVSITEKAYRNDDFTYVLIGESPEEKRQQTGKYLLPQSPADIVGPSSTKRIEPVEVIDLYTPSPDCRVVAVSQQSRISGDCSNFIDLTRSPLFLEL